MSTTVAVYRVYIKATPQAIWDGWSEVLSDLKSLLETGKSMYA